MEKMHKTILQESQKEKDSDPQMKGQDRIPCFWPNSDYYAQLY